MDCEQQITLAAKSQFPITKLIRPYPSDADGWREDSFRFADFSGVDVAPARYILSSVRAFLRSPRKFKKIALSGCGNSISKTDSGVGAWYAHEIENQPNNQAL
jgi:hypothetical protein